MQNSGIGGADAGLGLQYARCKRDWHHDEEPRRYSTSQLCGCNKQSWDGKCESRNKLDRHAQLTSERKLGFLRRRCGNGSRDSDVTRVPHQRCNTLWNLLGREHAEGSSQVHDELTLLNLSHIQRVLCTEFLEEPDYVNSKERRARKSLGGIDHEIQNAELMTSPLSSQVACTITKPDLLACEEMLATSMSL